MKFSVTYEVIGVDIGSGTDESVMYTIGTSGELRRMTAEELYYYRRHALLRDILFDEDK